MALAEAVQNAISRQVEESTKDSLFREMFTSQFSGRIHALLVDSPPEDDSDFNNWLIGVREKVLKVVDSEVVREIDEICHSQDAGESRIRVLTEAFNACLDISFEMFWGMLESIVRMNPAINLKQPTDFQARNKDIALAFVETVKTRPNSGNLHCRIQEHHAPESRKTFFRGAAVPRAYPLFQKFSELCNDQNIVFKIYEPLLTEFVRLCEKASDGQQNGYPTSGTRDGWEKLLAVLEKQHQGKIHVITTQHEYLPMIDLKGTAVTVVDSGDPGKIAANVKAALATCLEDEQPVVLISSVRRTGERIDVDSIMREIKSEYPNAICVIDSAQDYAMHDPAAADVVSYSKRYCGSGAGVLMISKTLDMLLGNPFKIKSGISLAQLAVAVASLKCAVDEEHFANDLAELLTKPKLWLYDGKGVHIKKWADAITERIGQLGVTVSSSPDPEDDFNENIWRQSRVISLSGLDVSPKDLAEKLERDYDIQVCWFCPRLIAGFDEIAALASRDYSAENCSEFFERLRKFQSGPASTYLLEMLTLPEVFNGDCECNEDTFNRQRDYLFESAKRQEIIRILIDITMSGEDLDHFISAFSSTLSSLRQTAPLEAS